MSTSSNLAHAANVRHGVAGCLSAVADDLLAFAPGPAYADRSFWSGIAPDVRAPLMAAGESVAQTEWPELTDAHYQLFTQTGDRATFEDIYFDRRRRLNHLVLAELSEGNGRFIAPLIEGLWLVLGERGWQLPAHNAHSRGGKRAPLADPENPVIDLFAAETGAQLAVIDYLLGDQLGAASPLLMQRLERELQRRIVHPYLNRHFWWMGNGDEPMNNWTPWCTQNVLLCTFVRSTDQATRRAVLIKAAHSLDAFLKDYSEDGACDEGPLYYRHAALCFWGALRVMDTVSPGAFSQVWSGKMIRNMADYLVNVHVADHHYINFADSSAVLPPCGAREFLFGQAVGSAGLCALAVADFSVNPSPENPNEINLFYRLLALKVAPEMAAFATPASERENIYYPSCGLFVARDETYVLAVKAGDNGDGHNHNDVGSVTLYKNGQPLLIDVGVETYSAQTFSKDRYDLWTMQSAYHNLPSFAGIGQRAGAEFAARDVVVGLQAAQPEIMMDIAGAYPAEAEVKSYKRHVRLVAGHAVEIEDIYEGVRSAELSLLVKESPEVTASGFQLGNLAHVNVTGGGPLRVEKIAITDARLRQAWPDIIFRVLIPIKAKRLMLRIE